MAKKLQIGCNGFYYRHVNTLVMVALTWLLMIYYVLLQFIDFKDKAHFVHQHMEKPFINVSVYPFHMQMFIAEYMNEVNEAPPLNIDTWFDYAQSKRCSLEHSTYARIYKDLSRFKEKHQQCIEIGKCDPESPVITSEQISRASFLPHTCTISYDGSNPLKTSDENFSYWLQQALADALPFLPPFKIVLNRLDEPRVFKRRPLKQDYKNAKWDGTHHIWKAGWSDVLDIMKDVCDEEMDRSKMETHGFFLGPTSFSASQDLIPVFSSSSVSECFSDILMPSSYYLWSEKIVPWQISLDQDDWDKKQMKFVWRGSTTGGGAASNGRYMDFHRHRFVTESKKINVPKVDVDVGFTRVVQCEDRACKAQLDTFSPLSQSEDHSESVKYKYLPDIDGNTFSQRSLPFFRFSQSLIFKMSLFEDWITEQIIPFEHFVPVSMDLKDLEDRLRWAVENDDKAKIIAKNGQDFAARRLRYEDMQCYLSRLIMEYQKLTMSTA